MSQIEGTVAVPAGFAVPGDYKLSSDVARLSLPSEYRDDYRTLAWVNSICFLFLLIGIVGLKAPRVIVRPLAEMAEPVPLEVLPPEEVPKIQPQEVTEEEPAPTDAPIDAPPIITIVAPADAQVPFAVPTEGVVALSPQATFIPPPPAQPPPAPARGPQQFNPNAQGGFFPDPLYPAFAMRNRQQGTVVLEFTVDASGAVTSVKVQKTSGFNLLDEAAMKVVKERWKFPPGSPRYYFNKFTFELK